MRTFYLSALLVLCASFVPLEYYCTVPVAYRPPKDNILINKCYKVVDGKKMVHISIVNVGHVDKWVKIGKQTVEVR